MSDHSHTDQAVLWADTFSVRITLSLSPFIKLEFKHSRFEVSSLAFTSFLKLYNRQTFISVIS